MRRSVIILALWTACPGIASGQESPGSICESKKYRAGYEKGRAEADREIEKQAATIYTFGLRPLTENLSRETGLPLRGCGGCFFDDEVLGLSEGHNTRILEWIKVHGDPTNSFKPWTKELFGLGAYIESRRKLEKPAILTPDGPALKSPDGFYSVRTVVKEERVSFLRVSKSLALDVCAEGDKPQGVPFFHGDIRDQIEVFWGPKGSGFAVLAWQRGKSGAFEAIDLRRSQSLRFEVAARPEEPRTGRRPGPLARWRHPQ